MEEVCQRDNLVRALKRVKTNQGSPGIDGLRVAELADYLKEHWPRIREQLLQGAYQPQPVKRVKDKRVLKLLRAFLNAGVLEHGLVSPATEGTPQGGPLSPLLSNLMLDVLDKELERGGHRFVRYADDCNLYVRSVRAGERVMSGVRRFLENKLKVNQAKSAVARPEERKFLGFTFTFNGEPKRRIAPQSLKRFKLRVRELIRTGRHLAPARLVNRLKLYLSGWRSYFGLLRNSLGGAEA